MLRRFVFVLSTLTAVSAYGQRQHHTQELGLFLGGSYYIGDLNPTGHFNSLTQPAGGLAYRYNFNPRFDLRGNLYFGHIMADDSRSDSYQQQSRNLSFKSKLVELAAIAEFNFLEYQIGSDKHPFTPFMFLGVAGFNFSPQAQLGNYWVNLQQLKTEGQSKPYHLYQVSIPFGAGLKTSLAKRIGLVLEWGMRKTFTDYLDDVSTVYTDPGTLYSNGGAVAVALGDRSTNGTAYSKTGSQRGNPRTKDWYSFAGVTLSFQLKERNKPCASYGIERKEHN